LADFLVPVSLSSVSVCKKEVGYLVREEEKVVLSGFLVITDQDREIIEAHLPRHIRLTRAETGCLAFAVAPDPHNAARYLVKETFASKAAFETHQARVKTSDWGRATAHMQRHYTIESQGSNRE
jgi:(4S)-4-hydroxy-5-phosphonooxypentane-2,3-dione isomerase